MAPYRIPVRGPCTFAYAKIGLEYVSVRTYLSENRIRTLYTYPRALLGTCNGKSKVEKWRRTFVIAPLSRHCHSRGAQVHGAHRAASHIPTLYLPSRSRYAFTDPERMEGWVSPGPGCKQQLAHGWYATARGQLDSNLRPRGRKSSTLTTRLSRHPLSVLKYNFLVLVLVLVRKYLLLKRTFSAVIYSLWHM